MDSRKQAALQTASSELLTVTGLRQSAHRIVKALGTFEPVMDFYSLTDIEQCEQASGPTRRRKGKV